MLAHSHPPQEWKWSILHINETQCTLHIGSTCCKFKQHLESFESTTEDLDILSTKLTVESNDILRCLDLHSELRHCTHTKLFDSHSIQHEPACHVDQKEISTLNVTQWHHATRAKLRHNLKTIVLAFPAPISIATAGKPILSAASPHERTC